MGDCVFCAIGAGEADADLVACRTARTFTIPALRQRPANRGQLLVLPVDHVTSLWSMADDMRTELFAEVSRIARAMPAAFGAEGSTVVQNNDTPGQTLFHVHVHVVPRHQGDGFGADSSRPPDVPHAVRAKQAAAVRSALQSVR